MKPAPRALSVRRLSIVLLAGRLLEVSGQEAVSPGPPAGTEPTRTDKSQFNLFHPTPRALLRDMEALYENPYTVDAGHFQVETYPFGYRRDHDRSRNNDTVLEGFNFAPTTLRLGLLNNVDAHLALAPYTVVRTKDRLTSSTVTQRGFGDTILRLRVNFWGNEEGSSALAATPFCKFPTSQEQLGNDAYEGGVVLAWAQELPRSWWMILTPEIDAFEDVTSSGYHAEFANTLYLWHSIAGEFSGYVEFASRVSGESSSAWIGTFDLGLTYMLTRNIQLDTGTRIGVSRAADDLNPFVGLSVRF